MTARNFSYKTSNKIRLPASELTLGMRVMELDRPWEDTPFIFQGFTIESDRELKLLRELCHYVTVDVFGTVDVKPPSRRAKRQTVITTTKKSPPPPKLPVEQELGRARKTYNDSSAVIRTMLDDVRLGLALDTPHAKEIVNTCVDSILRNPDALLLLSTIKNKDDYTAQHSLNVAILSICLGRQVGLEHNQLLELGLCGLLHDVGKLLTPDNILNKDGRLSVEEFEVMKRHTTHGRDILMSNDRTPLATLDVAHAHHEALDGSGYPRALNGNSLSLWTRMVAITDTYDAITSTRVYQTGETSFQALRILHAQTGIRFDPKMCVQFIRAIGIFPPGSVVQLSDGRVGIVIQSHATLKLRPRILIVRETHEEQIEPYTLDLSTIPVSEQGNPLNIVRVIRPEEEDIDTNALNKNALFRDVANIS